MGVSAGYSLPLTGIVLLGALTLSWGLNWPAMKLGLTDFEPWTFRTFTLVTGGLGLLAIAKVGGRSLNMPRQERWPLCVVALFNITAWHMFSAYGLTLIHASRAAIIAYTMPLWAVILGRLILREPLTRARTVALVLGLTAMAILIGPELRALWTAPVGALLVLCASICWAAGTVLLKYFRWTMPTVLLTAWQLLLGVVPVIVGKILFEPTLSLTDVSLPGALGTAYAALIGVLFCHYVWFKVVQMLPSAVAAISTLGIPVVGVFSSGLILAEPLGLGELTALALIVPALGLVLFGQNVATVRPRTVQRPPGPP